MAPLRVNFQINSVYDLLPWKANLFKKKRGGGGQNDPSSPFCQGPQTTEHVLSTRMIHMEAQQSVPRAFVINAAKGDSKPPVEKVVFTIEGATKSWVLRATKSIIRKKAYLTDAMIGKSPQTFQRGTNIPWLSENQGWDLVLWSNQPQLDKLS